LLFVIVLHTAACGRRGKLISKYWQFAEKLDFVLAFGWRSAGGPSTPGFGVMGWSAGVPSTPGFGVMGWSGLPLRPTPYFQCRL
jgi:hypothetical protein